MRIDANEQIARWRRLYEDAEAERDRYRAALVEISDADSGHWGWIAFNALHPERVNPHG